MARKNKKKQAVNDFFTDDVVETPTEGASIFRTPDKQALFYRWMIRINVFVMLPLMVIVIFGMAADRFLADGEAPPSREEVVSEFRPLAEEAVNRWVEDEPMPGLELLGWSYAVTLEDREDVIASMEEDETLPEDPEEVASIDSTEVHYFNLTTSSGTFYTASVQVAHNPVDGARVASDVSLIVDEPMALDPDYTGFDEDQVTEVTEGMTRAAQNWSEAYYSADPDELKLAVGDGRDGYGYMPMPAAEEIEASVDSAMIHPAAEITEESPQPNLVYARVNLTIIWPLPEMDDDEYEAMQEAGTLPEPDEMTVSYDVLMEDADTQAPVIVAWGPVGEYELLEPFSNAVEGREFEVGELDQPGVEDPAGDEDATTEDDDSEEGTEAEQSEADGSSDEQSEQDADDADDGYVETDPEEIDDSGDESDDENTGW